MGELERIKAELEAAKTPEKRVADQLWDLRNHPKKVQIAAWARLMKEQGVDPNGIRARYWAYGSLTIFQEYPKNWHYKKTLRAWRAE